MRIVNVIQRYPPAIGGAETWCREICQYLARQGHQVRVLTMDINKEEEYWQDPLDSDGHTLALGRLDYDDTVFVRRYRHSLPNYSVYHEIYRKILDEQFQLYFYGPHSAEMYGRMWHEIKAADIVILHTLPHPHNYAAYIIAKLLEKRVVIVPYFHPGHVLYERPANHWLMQGCDAVIALSEFEKEHLAGKGITPQKIHVTGCGIHPEKYQPQNLNNFKSRLEREFSLEQNDRVVTFIGRKSLEKGVGYLIEAIRGLLSEMPVKLFLVGPSFEWYEKLYRTLSAAERKYIIDLGVISHQDKVNLLHLSHLLVLPSKYESFGIVFLEAWTCGVPVLGTDEGGLPSVIGPGGFTSKFGDVENIRFQIRAAFTDPEGLRSMGARGKARLLENFTWDIIGQKVEKVLWEVQGNSRPRQKIAIVANAYPPNFMGGAELVAQQEAKLLKERGFDVAVFAGELNNDGERHSVREDTYDGVPVRRVCLHSRDYSLEFFNFFHRRVHEHFEDFLDSFSPNVVHFHNVTGLSVSLLQAAKRRRIKALVTLHDHWGFCLKNTLIKTENVVCTDHTKCAECLPFISGEHWRNVPVRMRRDYVAYQLEAVDKFVSPSKYLAGAYARAGINREKIEVINYALDLKRFTDLSKTKDARVRFSFVGYMGRHKGVHVVLKALSMLNGERHQLLLNMVGDGEERPRLEQSVRELGCEESVRFWGKVDNARMPEVYRETDVLLLPSIWPENQPLSITEAMTARIPSIASRVGGIPELIEDGRTGYLFEPGNAADLACKMSAFIADRSKVVEFGDNAYKKLSPDRIEKAINRIISLYQSDFEPDPAASTDRPTIACAGRSVHVECSAAIEILDGEGNQDWQILMADWLDEYQLRECRLLWVVDKDMTIVDVLPGLRNHLPLLVPAANSQLKELCVREKCGLYYTDALEARECLEYLVENNDIRGSMGQNGFRFFYSCQP